MHVLKRGMVQNLSVLDRFEPENSDQFWTRIGRSRSIRDQLGSQNKFTM